MLSPLARTHAILIATALAASTAHARTRQGPNGPPSFAEPAWLERSTFGADAPAARQLGTSLAQDGRFVAAGAPFDDGAGMNAGAAIVFEERGSSWVEVAHLVPDDAHREQYFGHAVALAGDALFVATPFEDGGIGYRAGAVYAFVRSGSRWVQTQTLVGSEVSVGSQFGWALAADGDRLLVAGRGLSAVAYEFTRTKHGWIETATLRPASSTSASFGESIALDGDLAVVGDWGDATHGIASGAAYVFRRTASGWEEEAKLVGAPGAPAEWFGYAVALSGARILVGAPFADADRGVVYAFSQAAGAWSQEARLVPSDATAGDQFGFSIAMDGERALVGSPHRDAGDGATYALELAGGAWTFPSTLSPANVGARARFGFALCLDGDRATVSAPRDPVDGVAEAGLVHAWAFGVRASVGRRGGGPNAPVLHASAPRLGATTTFTVDFDGTRHATALVLASGTPRRSDLGGGRVLLIEPRGASVLGVTTRGRATLELALPNDPALAGATFHAQAMLVGGGAFELSDALALRLGD